MARSSVFIVLSLIAITNITVNITGAIAQEPNNSEPYKIPAEITPAIRAACESEVRALCFGLRPTEAGVVSCVRKKFNQLGSACQGKLTAAGLR
jgi:hypothetical protein